MRIKAILTYFEQHHLIGKWYPLLVQLFKFCLIGAFNTFLHFGVYYSLTRYLSVQFLIANAIAFIIAATSSYFLNKFWTFQDKSKDYHKQYPKFIIIAAVGLLMHEGLLYLFVENFELHDLIALIIAAFIVVFWNFFMNRLWTFRNNADSPKKTDLPNVQKSEVV